MPIRFYRTGEVPYGCFSNFTGHPIFLGDARWSTNEHYFQAQKFVGTPRAEEIRRATSPMIAARMGRSRAYPLRPDWEAVKDDIMRHAVYAKFAQHEDIRAILLGTGEEAIIEDAPKDYYRGCGKDGTGKNMLGVILIETRDILRREARKD